MADYFQDILDRLQGRASLAKAVHPHPFTGDRDRLHAQASLENRAPGPALSRDLFSDEDVKGLPDLFSEKAK
ncbi:MAG: hypothetical protein ABJN40_17890 [Sneathiella sp.]